ncbi:MAG: hypothetical protein Q8S73_22235, partial [Deltaproteobacteria bacterium]|nr:hypothetical protein [Deltaproteobacteria bacterium]
MKGPFGGDLALTDGVTREALPAPLAAALAAAQTHAWPRAADADVVFFSFGEGVTYEGALTSLRPWSEAALPTAASLAVLGRVAECAARLHGRGLVHGDLRAEMIWLDAGNAPVLLFPARASAPGAALRAR